MKSSLLIAAFATSGAVAKPHNHYHRRAMHAHNHHRRAVTEEVVTVTVCKLGSLELPGSVCDYYVDKGVLKYVDDGSVQLASPISEVASAATTIATAATTVVIDHTVSIHVYLQDIS
jgi:hypothetical protein